MNKLERIDKIIASQGILTRSEVKRMAKKGLILIDGAIVKDSSVKINPESAKVVVNGKPIEYNRFIYLMMNKPAGILSASRDPKTPTVIDLLDEAYSRPGLFPAGRLDKDTTGLIIVTNDGGYAHQMMSPKNEVFKVYHVLAAEAVEQVDIDAFESGIILADDTECLPAYMNYVKNPDKHPFYSPDILEIEKKILEVKIAEGKYHQVKRMFGARKNKVEKLRRIAIGQLKLCDMLKEGEVKRLDFDDAAKALKK